MKYIVRHTEWVPERAQCVYELKKQIPELIIVKDNTRNAMDTFLNAMYAAQGEACVHFEDDVVLCDGFKTIIERIVANSPDMVIQFFSLSKKVDKTQIRRGRTFMMTQCFYLPTGYSEKIAEYYKDGWLNSKWAEGNPTGFDIMIARYLADNHLDYLNYIPSLVQHEPWKSAINAKRSTGRQAPYFKGMTDSK